MGSRKQEFLAQRDEMLEKYHAFLEKPSRGYARLLKAFPHLQQTEAHRRLEHLRALYRQRRDREK